MSERKTLTGVLLELSPETQSVAFRVKTNGGDRVLTVRITSGDSNPSSYLHIEKTLIVDDIVRHPGLLESTLAHMMEESRKS